MEIIKHTHEDGERFYEINGEFYPSSTTILEAYPLEKGLKDFLQDKTREQAEKILNSAGLQGSKIHHTIELVLMGEDVKSSGFTEEQVEKLGISDYELKKYLQKSFTKTEDFMMRGFMEWWEKFSPKTVKSEQQIYSKKYKYAGTMDWLGYIEIKGEKILCVIDWKTGRGLYKNYDLQVSSYIKAYCEMFPRKTHPKRAFLLQLGKNKCGYSFKEIKELDKDFERFLRILETWKDIHPNARPKDYKFSEYYKLTNNK
jgi:hypothetical protein